jgi:hypothetical protein
MMKEGETRQLASFPKPRHRLLSQRAPGKELSEKENPGAGNKVKWEI